jgi:predicted transcriptional regulator
LTVNELLKEGFLKPAVITEGDREISGVYIGDLLSWVMGNASSGDVWITIMSNINILAVATLTDCSAVILAEGVTLEDDIIKTANEKGINILYSDKSAYDTAVYLHSVL